MELGNFLKEQIDLFFSTICNNPGEDIGNPSMLQRYGTSRTHGAAPIVAALHSFQLAFQPQSGPFAMMRNAGVSVLDRFI